MQTWFSKKFSFISKGIRYKLRIAFSLMSIIPLLVCSYLFLSYSASYETIPFSLIEIILSFSACVVIAVIGFIVAKQIIDPIVAISTEAQSIARGNLNKEVVVSREDEIGDLSGALHQITRRIRDNMEELRNYGERTQEINTEINKRVVILSGLLQVSSLVTQGAKLNEIFEVAITKLSQLKNATWGILVLKQDDITYRVGAQVGLSNHQLESLLQEGYHKIFNSIILNKDGWLIDAHSSEVEAVEAQQILGTSNIMLVPIFRHTRIAGFMGAGNNTVRAPYKRDDLDLLLVFAKQIAIAIENDYLVHRVERLEIKDTLTGLYNRSFIEQRLQEEIKRAMIYQRPCGFLRVALCGFSDFIGEFGQLEGERLLKDAAHVLEDICTDADRVARYGDSDFAIVLPEKNRKQSNVFAQDIQKKLSEAFAGRKGCEKLSVTAIATENPIDGANAQEIVQKVELLLEETRQQGASA